jgi:hypothetical protein
MLRKVFLDESNAKACTNGSSAVADCLHTYLERDFPSIEAIVFPKNQGFVSNYTNIQEIFLNSYFVSM